MNVLAARRYVFFIYELNLSSYPLRFSEADEENKYKFGGVIVDEQIRKSGIGFDDRDFTGLGGVARSVGADKRAESRFGIHEAHPRRN
jgi:hypothetical protein